MILIAKAISKATAQTVAFLILIFSLALQGRTRANDSNLEAVKKRVINLLIQKQKKQALSTLSNFISSETNKSTLKEARDFRLQIAKKFLTKEAQEAYEMSINLTLDNPKEAKKNNDECLALDPDQLECLIQQLRLSYREKKKKSTEPEALERVNRYYDSTDLNWIKISIEKSAVDFKNITFYHKENGKMTEERLAISILEVDRAMAAKNFSRAKEVLQQINTEHSDWPDLIYFKNKIDLESTENKALIISDMVSQYQNKCKNLSKSVIRKYRYDFDLCQRGV